MTATETTTIEETEPGAPIAYGTLDEFTLRRNPALMDGWLLWISARLIDFAERWQEAGNALRPCPFCSDQTNGPAGFVEHLQDKHSMFPPAAVWGTTWDKTIRSWIDSDVARPESPPREPRATTSTAQVEWQAKKILQTKERHVAGWNVTVRNDGPGVVQLRTRQYGSAGPMEVVLEPGETREVNVTDELWAAADEPTTVTILSSVPASR
jgi:hypothetical protein